MVLAVIDGILFSPPAGVGCTEGMVETSSVPEGGGLRGLSFTGVEALEEIDDALEWPC